MNGWEKGAPWTSGSRGSLAFGMAGNRPAAMVMPMCQLQVLVS